METNLALDGRHIFVTGGARGIGLSLALACKTAGASVTVMARSQGDLTEALRQLNAIPNDGKSNAIKGDVTTNEDLESAFCQAVEKSGAIYGLVCAAGVYGCLSSFADCDFEKWTKTIEINFIGTARTIHCALPFMNGPSGGRVILFSGGGEGPMPNFSDYVSSKGAIWRLTETLGAELAQKNIFLNAIAPGAVNTRLLDDLIAAGPSRVGIDMYNQSIQQREGGGHGTAKANALCLYLLSKKSEGLYGKTLSALWDSYQDFSDLQSLSKSTLFTYKRTVATQGIGK